MVDKRIWKPVLAMFSSVAQAAEAGTDDDKRLAFLASAEEQAALAMGEIAAARDQLERRMRARRAHLITPLMKPAPRPGPATPPVCGCEPGVCPHTRS